MNSFTAEEAKALRVKHYNKEKAMKRIMKDIYRAAKRKKKKVGYEDLYFLDLGRTHCAIDNAEALRELGYEVDIWDRSFGDGNIVNHVTISW